MIRILIDGSDPYQFWYHSDEYDATCDASFWVFDLYSKEKVGGG